MLNDFIYIEEILARNNILDFAKYVMPSFHSSLFHEIYYSVLDLFAHGKIKKLIVTIPPQHGKSLGSSQMLPSYMLGINPDLKIAIASYAFTLATRFNKRVQRIMGQKSYTNVFPLSRLKANSITPTASSFSQNADEFEVVDHTGGLRSVGREGALTGNEVDVIILDDLYKDAMEANSPLIRDNCWEWYTSVVKTRLHNNSQELIVFTRWHEDDLIGRIEKAEQVIELQSISDVDPSFKGWYKLNFDAIKEGDRTELDLRNEGEPLWPERHGIDLLKSKRLLDGHTFECLYQGRPSSKEGMLYGNSFQTYNTIPPDIIKYGNYTDTADTGDDKLCSVCYNVGNDGLIYITDVLYTSEPMEVTDTATANMMIRNNTRISYIESNNGGRGFARSVSGYAPGIKVEWFHQSGNKESRILSNSATVLQNIRMPEDWRIRWPEFYNDLINYKRIFRANRNDDAPDVLTGIVETESVKERRGIRVPKR